MPQVTSLPFLLAATEIGVSIRLLDPTVAAGLMAAELLSVLASPQ